MTKSKIQFDSLKEKAEYVTNLAIKYPCEDNWSYAYFCHKKVFDASVDEFDRDSISNMGFAASQMSIEKQVEFEEWLKSINISSKSA